MSQNRIELIESLNIAIRPRQPLLSRANRRKYAIGAPSEELTELENKQFDLLEVK